MPRTPLIQVRDPGGLSHLAVVDDVDSHLGLPPHDVADGVVEHPLESGGVLGLPELDPCKNVEKLGRPCEAARVRRENPVRQNSIFSERTLVEVICARTLSGRPRRNRATEGCR